MATTFSTARRVAKHALAATILTLSIAAPVVTRAQETVGFALRRQQAERGDALAQYVVGLNYLLGDQAVSQDYAEAAKWLGKAANQGLSRAQYMLGGMYADGLGVPQDVVRAHMWFILSAAQGDRYAIEAVET